MTWCAALAAFLGLAVWSDLRALRVPNALVAFGLAVALVPPLLSVPDDLLVWPRAVIVLAGTWAAGLALGGLLLWPLYLRGAMGAGDVKLMAMAGAFLGPDLAWRAVLYACVAGGVLGLVQLAWRRLRRRAPLNQQAYAPAIASGTIAAVALHGLPIS